MSSFSAFSISFLGVLFVFFLKPCNRTNLSSEVIAKKKIQLQWIDYFLSHCEIYLEFVDENDWEQYIRFDLCLKTIEYDWIEKKN